nr:uncharacterized protein LOC123768776 [Procambarus clarkii]
MLSVIYVFLSAVSVFAMDMNWGTSTRSGVMDCQNSCQNDNKNERITDPSCRCDAECAHYGDCCHDAVRYNSQGPERYRCVSVGYRSVYMKDTCMSGWQDEEVAQLCLAGSPADISSSRDPLAHLPATSNTTSVTYTNYYCAICNNDSHHLTLWKMRLQCPSLHVDDKENPLIHLKMINNSWGVYSEDNSVYHECNIESEAPAGVRNRVCKAAMDECSVGWAHQHTRRLCHSYTDPVSDYKITYKNFHCALCNNVQPNRLRCYAYSTKTTTTAPFTTPKVKFPNLRTEWKFRSSPPTPPQFQPPILSFTVLIDFTDSSGSNEVGFISNCGPDEIWDIFFRKCRNVVCGHKEEKHVSVDCSDTSQLSSYHLTEMPTTISSNTTIIESTYNISFLHSQLNESKVKWTNIDLVGKYIANVSLSTIDKNNTCLKITLLQHEYTIGDNGILIVEKYGRLYDREEYEVAEGGVLVCSPQTPTEKFSPVMGWVSLAGLGLSCLCLLLHLAAFFLVPRLRNLPGKSLASLCLSLLTAYTIFIFSTFLKPRTIGCYISAVFMYYSFLASFCWMNIMAFDVWLTFQQAKDELRVSSGRQRSKFLFYCVYGWLLPALAVVVTVTLDKTAPGGLPSEFQPNFGQRWCWFGQRKALMVFFAAPLFVVMALNVVFFLITSYTIGASREPTLRKSPCSQNKKQFLLYVRLAVLMGLSWISGIVAGYLQLEAVWYVFVVLNTLQGVFIFLTFTCRSKVWRAAQKLWQNCLLEAKFFPSSSLQQKERSNSSQISIKTESSNL